MGSLWPLSNALSALIELVVVFLILLMWWIVWVNFEFSRIFEFLGLAVYTSCIKFLPSWGTDPFLIQLQGCLFGGPAITHVTWNVTTWYGRGQVELGNPRYPHGTLFLLGAMCTWQPNYNCYFPFPVWCLPSLDLNFLRAGTVSFPFWQSWFQMHANAKKKKKKSYKVVLCLWYHQLSQEPYSVVSLRTFYREISD